MKAKIVVKNKRAKWPVIMRIDNSPAVMFAIIITEAPFVQIQANFIKWSEPTRPGLTLVWQAAKAQVIDGKAENPYVDLGSVPATDSELTIDGAATYISEIGLTGFVDGSFVPMRLVWRDENGKEFIAVEKNSQISAA